MDHNPAVAGKNKTKQNCFEIFFYLGSNDDCFLQLQPEDL